MYAQALRKWSLHKYLMSYMWLTVVTMLLLIVCTPKAVTSMHIQARLAEINTGTYAAAPMTAPLTVSSVIGAQKFRNRACRDARSTPVTVISTGDDGGDGGGDDGDYNDNRADSIRNIRTSNSKIFRNSKLIRNIRQEHHRPHETDSIAYSGYYNSNAQTVFGGRKRSVGDRQMIPNQGEGYRKEITDNSNGTASAAVYEINNNGNRQNVPTVSNSSSPIINYNNNNLFNPPFSNLQQDNRSYAYSLNSLTNSAYTNLNIRPRSSSRKARRHIQPNLLQHLASQSATKPISNPLQSYHSPVRNTSIVIYKPTPFRYILETFEVPASLPFGEFTEQQRRLLLRQDEIRRLRLLQAAAAAAARSRRDSRGGSLDANSGVDKSYNYHQQDQQQQQQQLQQQHHNNNHQAQQHQQQQQQQFRKRSRRYCSARDPAQLAFEAPTVFEGKIISMTPDRRANFSATVEVKEIFKQQIGYRLQNYLRLQFTYRNTSGECDIYRETLRPRGLVRGDELEQGRVYLMFVQQIDLRNFTILGQPIKKTRRVIEAVKNAVSENYAQLASIRSITASNRTVENGKELRIICKVQGRPPPKVTWFKDHKSINRNRRLYQFVHYKKRSELIIRSFNSSDAGRYECRAKNKVNRNLERRAILIKAYPVPRYDMPTPQSGGKCPEDAYEFCLNGGTCKFFTEIGSYSCICPEGYMGERCDLKEVNNMPPSPTFKTGYIADDPNVLTMIPSARDFPDIDSMEDDDEDGDGQSEEDDMNLSIGKDQYIQ